MIKFFRKIRQNFLTEGKTGKYFKYAFGEIVLVVIGILIAIQINNWNEKQKIQTQKNEILWSLNKEFKKNLVELNKTVEMCNHIIDASNELLIELTNTKSNKFKGEKLDSLLKEISDFPIWKRSDLNIDVIQNSNIFNQSEDSELMELVFEWKAQSQSTQSMEERGTYAYQYYIDFIKKNGSWREIDKYMWEKVKGSKIMPSNDHLLLDSEFENCINSMFIYNTHTKNRYKNIKNVVVDIIKFTNVE